MAIIGIYTVGYSDSQKQQVIIGRLVANDTPKTYEAYRQHYCCYEDAPFAFADIKMIFNDEISAVIFCYGNEALAKLEMFPLKKLIGQKFELVFIGVLRV